MLNSDPQITCFDIWLFTPMETQEDKASDRCMKKKDAWIILFGDQRSIIIIQYLGRKVCVCDCVNNGA